MYIQITSSLPRYIISHTHNVVRQVSQRRSPLLHRLLTNYKKEVPYCTNVTMTFHITIIHYKKKGRVAGVYGRPTSLKKMTQKKKIEK